MDEFKPEPMGYYAVILGDAETAEAHDGEVHNVLVISGTPLSGYPPVVRMEPKPEVPRGKRLVRCYRRTAEAVEVRYRLEDMPPRVFSKLKVVAALTQAGVWPQVKAWMEAKGLYDLYLAAQDFAEDNEYFAQGLAALKPVVGWTDEQVEELLEKCKVES